MGRQYKYGSESGDPEQFWISIKPSLQKWPGMTGESITCKWSQSTQN